MEFSPETPPNFSFVIRDQDRAERFVWLFKRLPDSVEAASLGGGVNAYWSLPDSPELHAALDEARRPNSEEAERQSLRRQLRAMISQAKQRANERLTEAALSSAARRQEVEKNARLRAVENLHHPASEHGESAGIRSRREADAARDRAEWDGRIAAVRAANPQGIVTHFERQEQRRHNVIADGEAAVELETRIRTLNSGLGKAAPQEGR